MTPRDAVRRALVLLLLGVHVTLLPLAHASPPDQTWIGGFYDDADYDDVVLLVTSIAGAVAAAPPAAPPSPVVIVLPSCSDAEPHALCEPPGISPRAPPAT